LAKHVPSRAELEFGVHSARDGATHQKRQAKLALLDDRVRWLEFDRAASAGYGALAARTSLTGARLRGQDALIAGPAYSLGASAAHREHGRFAPFATLLVVLARLHGRSDAGPWFNAFGKQGRTPPCRARRSATTPIG